MAWEERMTIWHGLSNGKIRSKKDAAEFLDRSLQKGNEYYLLHDDESEEYDVCIRKTENEITFSCRHKSLRGDWFNPYLQLDWTRQNMIDFVYNRRKSINKQFFSNDN